MSETDQVRWGFIGAGSIARSGLAPAVHHARNAVLHAVAARDTGRARDLEPAGPVFDSYDALLADPQVEAVYISLPNDAHVPWALKALDAGKHVLCEKPLGLDAAEVRQLAERAERTGLLAVEAMWARWHPRAQAAQRLLAAGGLGGVRSVSCGFTFDADLTGNYRLDPQHGGGALYDVGCYGLAAILWAFGEGVVTGATATTVDSPAGVDVSTHATMSVRGGSGDGTAELHVSMAEPPRQWLVITGEHGRLELPDDAFASRGTVSWLRLVNAEGEHVEEFPPVDPYQIMVEAFSTRARGGEAWLMPLSESLRLAAGLDTVRAASGLDTVRAASGRAAVRAASGRAADADPR